MSKYWVHLNTPHTPCDTISALHRPGTHPPMYATKSTEMADIARNHHDNVQRLNSPSPPHNPGDPNPIDVALLHLSTRISTPAASSLEKHITPSEIHHAMTELPPGKAPGLDSLPHELWQTLMRTYDQHHSPRTPHFDIITTLAHVFNDIEKFGTAETSKFAEGWMCPLYKKNDRTDISNY